MADLTDRQKVFVDEYLVDLNATKAAIRAGYAEKNANRIASEMMTKPHVKEAIDKAMKERQERTQVTQDEIVQYWARIMRADITDYTAWSESGSIKLKSSEEVDGSVIQSVSESRNGAKVTKEVKLKDGMRASEMLAKHLGMFTDRHEINGGGPVQVFLNVPAPKVEA